MDMSSCDPEQNQACVELAEIMCGDYMKHVDIKIKLKIFFKKKEELFMFVISCRKAY